jgi:16S rRNA (guanine527-N7)-methyltransferase
MATSLQVPDGKETSSIPSPPVAFLDNCAQIKVSLSIFQLELCQEYLVHLLSVSGQFRVTITNPHRAWFRHILDSLTLAPLISIPNARILDVGSGPGLPGIPLAIALPNAHMVLNERRGKVALWLETTCKTLLLTNCSVAVGRVQELMKDPAHINAYDVVVVRRLAPMADLLTWTHPLLRDGGKLIAMKGKQAAEELKAAQEVLDALGWETPQIHHMFEGTENAATLVECVKGDPTLREERTNPKSAPSGQEGCFSTMQTSLADT